MNRLIGAILLVAGTTIGAGMLALPVTTGLAGFIPSIILMTLFWLFMLLTAFYLLEVNLRMKGQSNIISMVKKTLGRPGEVVAWICYLLLLYSLVAAYIVGCSQILQDIVGMALPAKLWPLFIFLFFGTFVYFGTKVVDGLNRFLMIGLIVCYIAMIVLGVFHIDLKLLLHSNFLKVASSIPVMATAFGYHIIIPSLSTYLNHDSRLLKKAIVMGSLIPFVVYLLWQLLAMGVIPLEGNFGLKCAAEKGLQATICLKEIIGNPLLAMAARAFAFFAIVTSLLGVSLSLSDFLADGLKIKRTFLGNGAILLLTFLPPLFFAYFYPEGFIMALNYAGIFVVVLLAVLPTLMAWFERYSGKRFVKSDFEVPGGKPLLITAIFLSVILLGVEVFS